LSGSKGAAKAERLAREQPKTTLALHSPTYTLDGPMPPFTRKTPHKMVCSTNERVSIGNALATDDKSNRTNREHPNTSIEPT